MQHLLSNPAARGPDADVRSKDHWSIPFNDFSHLHLRSKKASYGSFLRKESKETFGRERGPMASSSGATDFPHWYHFALERERLVLFLYIASQPSSKRNADGSSTARTRGHQNPDDLCPQSTAIAIWRRRRQPRRRRSCN